MIIFDFGFAVASSTAVIYNWALTFGQEFELVWSQRWSFITILYLGVRCLGVIYCSTIILFNVPTVSVNDVGCKILGRLYIWTPVVTIVTLGVVMIIRIYAMYQGSRKILIFLAVILLTLSITTGVLLAIVDSYSRSEEFVLSGIYQCMNYSTEENTPLLIGFYWEYVTGLIWEALALSFAVWIVIKHFRELQRRSRWNTKDCFTVLIKTHVFYFAAFAVTSLFTFGSLCINLSNPSSVGVQIYDGISQTVIVVQLFVLGPRLILDVRAHHAWLLADSDEGTAMTTIAFQEGISELTDSDV
ncbi:hypothetical protein BDR03DRAFT_967183 [Suillus americanus]|nr:hypothetical protein BDR03DRAFT_967183 [Suillus americanus]